MREPRKPFERGLRGAPQVLRKPKQPSRCCRFFDLPGELRNEIYGYVFANVKGSVVRRSRIPRTSLHDSINLAWGNRKKERGALAIRFVCRLFARETFGYLFRTIDLGAFHFTYYTHPHWAHSEWRTFDATVGRRMPSPNRIELHTWLIQSGINSRHCHGVSITQSVLHTTWTFTSRCLNLLRSCLGFPPPDRAAWYYSVRKLTVLAHSRKWIRDWFNCDMYAIKKLLPNVEDVVVEYTGFLEGGPRCERWRVKGLEVFWWYSGELKVDLKVDFDGRRWR